jgi:hypothetical protein
LSMFSCFSAIWASSFEKALFSSFAHFFTGSLNFGEFSFLSSLYIHSGYQTLVRHVVEKDSFILWAVLQFRDHFFCCAEAFQFHVVPFVSPFSHLLSHLSSIQ